MQEEFLGKPTLYLRSDDERLFGVHAKALLQCFQIVSSKRRAVHLLRSGHLRTVPNRCASHQSKRNYNPFDQSRPNSVNDKQKTTETYCNLMREGLSVTRRAFSIACRIPPRSVSPSITSSTCQPRAWYRAPTSSVKARSVLHTTDDENEQNTHKRKHMLRLGRTFRRSKCDCRRKSQ